MSILEEYFAWKLSTSARRARAFLIHWEEIERKRLEIITGKYGISEKGANALTLFSKKLNCRKKLAMERARHNLKIKTINRLSIAIQRTQLIGNKFCIVFLWSSASCCASHAKEMRERQHKPTFTVLIHTDTSHPKKGFVLYSQTLWWALVNYKCTQDVLHSSG